MQFGHVHMGYGIEHRVRLSSLSTPTPSSSSATPESGDPNAAPRPRRPSMTDTSVTSHANSSSGGNHSGSSNNNGGTNSLLARQIVTYPPSSCLHHTMFVNAAVDDTEQPFVFDLSVSPSSSSSSTSLCSE
jgi:hypothetical protein